MWSMFKNLVITEQDFIHIMETRKRSADDQDDQSSGKQFQIRWHGLSYFAHKSWLQRQIAHLSGHKNVPPSKRILNNISGLVKSGELTAIMGPSGAGKSTLLECLAGIRNEGRNGDFMVDGHKRKLKMSFIPQHDTYFGVLTVKETVVFACKLKQSTAVHNKEDYKSVILNNTGATNGVQKVHREATITDEGYYFDVADNILKALGLYEVRNVLVNSISGGQQKRVSIAQELVSKPDVLILDEPTSGLDSSSALLCIQLLRSITEQRHPMAILLTIHQPNPKIFHLLHKIYVLAVTGQCIYEDSPIALVDHLKSVCIECPIFYNPADFIIEVANSEHGLEKIDQLALTHQTQATSTHGGVPLQKILAYPKYPFFKHFWYLFHRCTLVTLRDPVTLYLRFGSMLFMPIFTAYIYGHNSGHATGCPANITISLDAEYFTEATARRWREAHAVTNNSSFLFFSMISLTFLSMIPTILSFPLSMNVLLKEKRNSWYSVGPAYLSLSLADAPFQLSFTLIFIIISYFGTGQVMEEWRFLSFTYIFVMVAFIGQANGFIVGALFMENVSVAIFLGPLMAISALMVSGFAVRVSIMPRIFQIMSSGSYFRYTLEALILTMYGFDRCADIGAKIANTRQMFTSWIKRMMDIVEVALNGNDEDDDYEGGVQPNGNQTNDVGQMSEIIADTIIAGIGGRKSADSGKIESLIVNHFDLKNEEYNNCIVQLLIAFITLRILAYFAVIWKTRNS